MDTKNTPRTVSIANRLNGRLLSNPAWVELFRAAEKVINEYVTKPRELLGDIRDPRIVHRGVWSRDEESNRILVNHVAVEEDGTARVHGQLTDTAAAVEFTLPSPYKEREVLIAGARLHGFDYFSSTLTDRDYARIMEFVEQFWPESGTPSFIRFIGYVKNMKLDMQQLWSDEESPDLRIATRPPLNTPQIADFYPYLEPVPAGKGAWENGKSYRTSHVQLDYDPLLSPEIDLTDLYYLFYYLAPIHLVFHRIIAEIRTPIFTNDLVPSPIVLFFDTAILDDSLAAVIDNRFYPAPAPAVTFAESAILSLNSSFQPRQL